MWSIFDSQTILVLLTFLFVMCTGVIALLLLSRRPAVGAGEWGLMFLAYVLSSLLLQLRRPDWDLVPTAFYVGFGILPGVLLWRGIRRWHGQDDLHLLTMIAWPLAGAALAYVLPKWTPINPGIVSTSTNTVLSILCMLACRQQRDLSAAQGVLGMIVILQVVRIWLYATQASRYSLTASVLLQAILITTLAAILYRAVSRRAAGSFGGVLPRSPAS
jgi:hypothetical protein